MRSDVLHKIYSNLNFHSIFFRRALRTAIAIFIAVFVYRYFSLTQGFWVPFTVTVVMQATIAATLRKGIQRLLGTVIGIVLGSLLVMKIQNPYWIDFFLVFFLFVAYYLKACNLVNYGIFVVPITIMIVFLVSALVPQESHALILARLYDTSLGALIGMGVTFLVLPNSLKPEVDQGMQQIMQIQYQYLIALCEYLLRKKNSELTAAHIRQQVEQGIWNNRRLFEDWRYELWMRLQRKRTYEFFLECTGQIGQFLFSLHHLARYAPSISEKEVVAALQIILQLSENALSSHSWIDLDALQDQITQIKIIKTETEKQLFVKALAANLAGYHQALTELKKLMAEFN